MSERGRQLREQPRGNFDHAPMAREPRTPLYVAGDLDHRQGEP